MGSSVVYLIRSIAKLELTSARFDPLNQSLVHCVISGNVGHDDAQQVVDVAAHTVDFCHLGHIFHHPGKFIEPSLIVMVGLEGNKHRSADVHLVGVQQRDAPRNEAVRFELLNPAPTGCRRKANGLSPPRKPIESNRPEVSSEF